jgi:predicted nucleic acid-binding protein
MKRRVDVIYWDASAVLPVLFSDLHSEQAREPLRGESVHLISSLSWAEVCAVISRIKRERHLADLLADAAYGVLESGPWRRAYVVPDYGDLRELADTWRLRGADLWHLATARALRRELPGLVLLTFDERLREAAQGEGLVPGSPQR